MLAWHLSWQLCLYVLSFEHARQFGPQWLEQVVLVVRAVVVLVVRAVLEVVGACEELEVFIGSIGAYTMIGGSRIVAAGRPSSPSSGSRLRFSTVIASTIA